MENNSIKAFEIRTYSSKISNIVQTYGRIVLLNTDVFFSKSCILVDPGKTTRVGLRIIFDYFPLTVHKLQIGQVSGEQIEVGLVGKY